MSENALPRDNAKNSGDKLIQQAIRQNDRVAMISQLAKDMIRENRYRTGELPRK